MPKHPVDMFTDMNVTFDNLFSNFKLDKKVTTAMTAKASSFSTFRVDTSFDALVIEVDLPGVASKDVDISATGNMVTVKGNRGGVLFVNRYTIDPNYDPRYATATMANGLLKVRIPGPVEPKSIHIDVK